MELNAVAVEQNKAAFAWGRRAANDWASVEALLGKQQAMHWQRQEPLAEIIDRRVAFLTAYQNAAWADQYRDFVTQVQGRETALGQTTLTRAVAHNLFKLMSYKDEYEVARLHTDAGFLKGIRDRFEGDFQLHYHLAPPLLARRNDRGVLQKSKFGPRTRWAFAILARARRLRGTALDIFGYTPERRQERLLINDYRRDLQEILITLNAGNHATALALALLPQEIKGFGHVKERAIVASRAKWAALMSAFRVAGR
jgi:indolepyruvate ferredoxin oxidoreductase